MRSSLVLALHADSIAQVQQPAIYMHFAKMQLRLTLLSSPTVLQSGSMRRQRRHTYVLYITDANA